MTEEQLDHVAQIVNVLYTELTKLVDDVMKQGKPHLTDEMETAIRQQLTEQIRFWKGY